MKQVNPKYALQWQDKATGCYLNWFCPFRGQGQKMIHKPSCRLKLNLTTTTLKLNHNSAQIGSQQACEPRTIFRSDLVKEQDAQAMGPTELRFRQ